MKNICGAAVGDAAFVYRTCEFAWTGAGAGAGAAGVSTEGGLGTNITGGSGFSGDASGTTIGAGCLDFSACC